MDLATHDLDVIRYLVDSPIESIHAECSQRIHSNHEDLATGIIRFEDGTIALLDVNWLTPVKMRELTVVGSGGMYQMDYLSQNLTFFENSHVGYWPAPSGQGVSEGNMIRYQIDRVEPLRIEIETFARAIRGESNGLVPLEDGIAAVAMAEAMLRASESHRAVRDDELADFLTSSFTGIS